MSFNNPIHQDDIKEAFTKKWFILDETVPDDGDRIRYGIAVDLSDEEEDLFHEIASEIDHKEFAEYIVELHNLKIGDTTFFVKE